MLKIKVFRIEANSAGTMDGRAYDLEQQLNEKMADLGDVHVRHVTATSLGMHREEMTMLYTVFYEETPQ